MTITERPVTEADLAPKEAEPETPAVPAEAT